MNLQVGGGAIGAFQRRNSDFNGVFQEWRYTFPKNESAEVFENLRSVLMNDTRSLTRCPPRRFIFHFVKRRVSF